MLKLQYNFIISLFDLYLTVHFTENKEKWLILTG